MKKSTKISLLVSLVMVLVGAIIIFISLLGVGFDIKKFSNMTFEKKVYDITESFNEIRITDFTDNIEVHLSGDDKCRIICYDNEKIYHEFNVNNNGHLMIFARDDRAWYEKIGIFYKENNKLQIYVPDYFYEEIYAQTLNGDITVPKDFTFNNAHLSTTNGKINLDANIIQNLTAETPNGDIVLNGELNGKIHALTTNGKIIANNIKNADWADFTTTNGNIELDGDVIRQFEAHSVNGSIKFGDVISDRIYMNTVNGSITGTVPANKSCMGKSTNGTVNIPNRAKDSGDFYFKTVNGNIDIKEK